GRGGRRGEKLESVSWKIGEPRWIGDRRAPGPRRGRAPPVQVGQRRALWQVGDGDVFSEGLDAVELFECLCGGCGVVIADLWHADHRDAFPAERAELAGRDRVRDDIGGPGQAVDAREQASGHLETMRLVSATSCLSWRTRSSGVANLISGWR